ncbi:MAG: hypothetical protein FH758_08725 [Firmicutes bacterium]|nr:hypothetical protein [Bacillota bacterium]
MLNNILLVVTGKTETNKLITLVEKLGKSASSLTVIYIIQNTWQGVLGDEWISSHEARNNFLNYMDTKQQQEVRELFSEIKTKATSMRLQTNILVKSGSILSVLSNTINGSDLIILPYTANKREVRKISQKINCPILTGPI